MAEKDVGSYSENTDPLQSNFESLDVTFYGMDKDIADTSNAICYS